MCRRFDSGPVHSLPVGKVIRDLSDDWPDGWLGVGVSADSFGIWAHLGRRECGADHSRPS